MPKILKILTGSQEGAELQINDGQIVRIGSADACDVIIVDAMMPEQALEIVADGGDLVAKALSAQIFAGNDLMKAGVQTAVTDYTVFTCGAVRLTVGPDDSPWPPLSWRPLEQLLEKREKTAQEEAAERQRQEEEERRRKEAEEAEQRRVRELKRREELKAIRQARRRRLLSFACWMLMLAVFLLGAAFAADRAWTLAEPPQPDKPDELEASLQQFQRQNLEELIQKYNLTLSDMVSHDGQKLTGNLPNTAIRLHIQSLLKNKYFGITYELTDDETLADAVRELLWGATNGCVRLVSLTDRNAVVSGMTASEEEWASICANIKADIPRLNKLETRVVYADLMSAKLVKAFDKAGFKVRAEHHPLQIHILGNVPEKRQQTFEGMLAEARKFFPPEVRLLNLAKWIPEPVQKKLPPQPAVVAKEPVTAEKPQRLPIASILMQPIPCLVMEDGSRYAAGAIIGDFTITHIALDAVTVTKDCKEYTFKP